MATARIIPELAARAGPGEEWWRALPELLTKGQYGAYRKARFGRGGASAVSNWISRGQLGFEGERPSLVEAGGTVMVDWVAADRELEETTHPSYVNRAGPELPGTEAPAPSAQSRYNEERAHGQRLLNMQREDDMRLRRGELVEAADVYTDGYTFARRLRGELLAIGEELAPELVEMIDELAIRDLVTRRLEAFLARFDEGLRKLVSDLAAPPADMKLPGDSVDAGAH